MSIRVAGRDPAPVQGRAPSVPRTSARDHGGELTGLHMLPGDHLLTGLHMHPGATDRQASPQQIWLTHQCRNEDDSGNAQQQKGCASQ